MMTPGLNMSAVLGQCPRKSDCDYIFKVYMALSVLGSFISACGGTPGYIVLLRCGEREAASATLQRGLHLVYHRPRLISVTLNADVVFQIHS